MRRLTVSQRLLHIVLVILFIAVCFGQYTIYMQNQVISEYSDMLDKWAEAYGDCLAEKWIMKDKQKKVIEIKNKFVSPCRCTQDLI
jgi:cytochrome c oxidase assembly factor CtaG